MSLFLSRTPYRISFFGGGTDYPAWYLKNSGAVLSMAINKHCYISCRYLPPYFPNTRHRIVWSHIEVVQRISEILHPAVRVALQVYGFDDSVGLEIHHQGDLPARTGIGSSSSFAVGLIKVLKALQEENVTKTELAMSAIELEQIHLKDTVGSQDQVAAAYGGLNVIRFNTDGKIEVEPVSITLGRREALEARLMLFYTGTDRLSSEHARAIVENIGSKHDRLRRMHEMVFQAADIMTHGDLDDIGYMLNETWRLKRGLAKNVSSETVDEIYDTALKAGALGGKLLGAGGAGFMFFYVPDNKRAAVRTALRSLIQVSVRIDQLGSIILYQGENGISSFASSASETVSQSHSVTAPRQ